MPRPLKWFLYGLLALIFFGSVALALLLLRLQEEQAVPPLAEDATVAELDAWVEGLHADRKFNGVVSVRRGGAVAYRRAVGSWDETGARALTPATPLRLASLSKPFTATAVLGLVQDGAVELDAPLSAYLPDCAWEGVTIRTLLNHSSGVPDRYMALADGEEVVTITDAAAYICEGELAGVPGETYRYNNSAYVLLAALVERVTGESFEAAMERLVFAPLDLSETRVWNLVSPDGGLEVAPTFNQWDEPPSAEPPTKLDGVAGDGAVHSSLNDLERFARAWSDGTVLTPELREEALTRGPGQHGLGWMVRDDGALWHNGSWLGARTRMEVDPARGHWLIIADNGGSLALDRMIGPLGRWNASSDESPDAGQGEDDAPSDRGTP